ncbi:ABC1 kinase family protein [Halobacillus karajensis]|uniref:Ubiquinone biosynthesis protein UbiB n=1 Tax=Halobacillus karajensis TaxID=195088 RepID=A0A024P4F1_9BACI|nr:AarF/UbiB family protein [Halobacillus karajensis]CDQ18767.1 putative ubiquinone biosynthesis protein UbiB [Halobacillus karajensis]CDQ23161.1 putative ubiquinone biosynthesis protein UbiB [Halobacillus karajensis]CDQ26643.1 putative ubiquinone biosynthesis protein UbiB [Halobacillus karajensis]
MRHRLKYISIYRISVIIWMALKFLIQIYWFKKRHRIWDERTIRQWEEMLAGQAGEYRKKAVLLGGLLIKFGQFLSSRGDLLPQSFIKELEGLVDRVEPVPFHRSRQTIEEDWNAPLNEYLASIEEDSIASASIGEVYKAYLKDGTPVAIKVQRYRVRETFRMDFKALKNVFWMLERFTIYGKKADLQALYREVVRVISNELDFTMELENGNHFKKRFTDFDGVYIPDYYSDLSTKRVLVMEWIEGAKITDLPFIKRHGIDREHIARRLFDLCVEQFVYAGMFHSDPHPGNLMLKEDGTIVVIDFGMVGEIKKEDANSIRKMIQGFILDDYDRVIESLQEMDFLLPDADTEKVKKLLKQTTNMYLDGNFDKLDAHMMNDMLRDLQQFVKEQPIQLPADYAFLGRATSIIVGVLTSVYPQVDLIQWGRPVIKEWMSGEDSSHSLYKEIAKETARPLLSLPRALIEFLEDGDKEREWKSYHQKNHLFHQYYLFYTFLSLLISGAGAAALYYTMIVPVLPNIWVGGVTIGIGITGFIVSSFNHLKMLRRIHHNRRNET